MASRNCFPRPLALRESKVATRKPYSVSGLGSVNVSRAPTVSGPAYTLTSTGYFLDGSKFEGYSVVVDRENTLNVNLDLPDKKKVVKNTGNKKDVKLSK